MMTQYKQQHSLLSQASWGMLEMKPKRDEKQEDTKRDIKGTRQKDDDTMDCHIPSKINGPWQYPYCTFKQNAQDVSLNYSCYKMKLQ
jgi:hypothetical protein